MEQPVISTSLSMNYATQVIVASSFDPQRGVAGHVPYESVTYLASRDGWYFISVAHHSGSTPGWIQVTVWGVGSIEHYTESGSIGNPAESRQRRACWLWARPTWYNVQIH